MHNFISTYEKRYTIYSSIVFRCVLQVITPYYWAYEDLLEDWESAKRKLHATDSRGTSDNNAQSKTVAGAVLSLTASGVKNVFSTNGQPRVRLFTFRLTLFCVRVLL